MNDIKRKFGEKFNMTDMGDLEFFLNVRVTRTKRFILLDPSVYINKVLDKFVDFFGSPHETRKCPLPSNAVDRIARDQGELIAQEQMYLDNLQFGANL